MSRIANPRHRGLFVTPSTIETVGVGTLVPTLPLDLAVPTNDGYVGNPPVSIPIAIPFDVPEQLPDEKCNVYVIYRTKGGISEVAKYGMTCQTDTDGDPSCKRPAEQVRDFNKEGDGYVYKYAIIIPKPVSRRMAFMIERAMTAQYIVENGGDLPSKHNLPCFVKVPDDLPDFEKDEKLLKRIEKATKWLVDLIKQYGK